MPFNNDRLKGEFYRAPMTKLASRSNVITQINELIEYFNSLSDMVDNTFDLITTDRERMKNILTQITNKTLHFKYILENFKPEITQHVEEKLASLMGTLSTNLNEVVAEYNKNLFNHAKQTDVNIADDVTGLDTLEEWDRSINHLSTDLGIRWFGGKLSDKFFVNQFNSILHLVKVNSSDTHNNEDYINSNTILEIFISTKKGMTWLVLGQDGNFGYNLVTKYQTKANTMNMKLASKGYFAPKKYDINKFDLDCIIDTLLTQDDINNRNVYINVKTNIPANSYSGREGYFISRSSTFSDEIDKRSTLNASSKLLYHDNKDIAYVKQERNTVEDVFNSRADDVETNYVINPKSKKGSMLTSNTDKVAKFYSELKIQAGVNTVSLSVTDKNSIDKTMINNAEKVSGRVINPENYIAVDKPYLKDVRIQPRKFKENGEIPVYNSGEQIEDLLDYRTIGKAQPILQNESMFEVDGAIGGETSVVSGDTIYGESKNDNTLSNKLYNNGSFDAISSKENTFHVLEKHIDGNIDNTINEIIESSIGTLAATNMGIYNFTKNAGIMNGSNGMGFLSIFESSSGIIYAGTANNEGIYYWNTDKNIWERTNIFKGSISKFVEDNMGYIFALSNNGGNSSNEPEFDSSELSYKTTRSVYRGKTPTTFYAFEDMLSKGVYDKNNNIVTNVESFNKKCYQWDNVNDAKWFIQTSSKNRKVFFNYAEDRWYVYNPASKKLFASIDKYFYKFKLHELHEKYDTVLDVLYTDDTLYISIANDDSSFVIEYKNGVERKIKSTDTIVKNNREIVKHNISLATYEDVAVNLTRG